MNSKRKQYLLFFLLFFITSLSVFVRFYNFDKLINFSLDPPFHLSEVKDMVDFKRLRLNGPMFQSKMVDGRGFFSGPEYYYLLAVLGITSGWNIPFMTGFFTLFWVFAFLVIFFWLKKRFGETIGLTVYGLLSFWPILVHFSRMIWNPYFLPLFGALSLMLLDLRKENKYYYFLSGLSFGIAFSAHYIAVLWTPIIIYVLLKDIKTKKFSLRHWLAFFCGATIPQVPIILFELRHNFYNIRTLLFQIRYYKPSPGYTFAILHYYLFPGIPVLAYVLGWILNKSRRTFLFHPILYAMVFLSIFSFKEDLLGIGQKPAYENNWSIAKQHKAINFILEDNEKVFEVAATISSDTRAMALRWWLRQAHHNPMSVIDYDKADILYLVAKNNRPPETETVWEVNTLRPFKIMTKNDLGDELFFYKLVRQKK